MKIQWYWHQYFEDLMKTYGEFLAENPNIHIVSIDWKYVVGQNHEGNWYLLCVYR